MLQYSILKIRKNQNLNGSSFFSEKLEIHFDKLTVDSVQWDNCVDTERFIVFY